MRKLCKHFHLCDPFGSSSVHTQEKCFWGFEFEPGSLPRWFAVFPPPKRVKQNKQTKSKTDYPMTYLMLVTHIAALFVKRLIEAAENLTTAIAVVFPRLPDADFQ